MENQPQNTSHNVGRREPSIDPVKAQGILKELVRKETVAAKFWEEHWGFYRQIDKVRENIAQQMGIPLEEYRNNLKRFKGRPEPSTYPVEVEASPNPIPKTSNAMYGRRASCSLERYDPLIKTDRHYPLTPVPPRSVYNPYKQTLMFLGSVEGDPISYQLPPLRREVTDHMFAEPRQLEVSQFDILTKLHQHDNLSE